MIMRSFMRGGSNLLEYNDSYRRFLNVCNKGQTNVIAKEYSIKARKN